MEGSKFLARLQGAQKRSVTIGFMGGNCLKLCYHLYVNDVMVIKHLIGYLISKTNYFSYIMKSVIFIDYLPSKIIWLQE